MDTDINLQIWLETGTVSHPALIVPYVQSKRDQIIRYRVASLNEGRNGSTRIKQAGQTQVVANQPTALTHLTIARTATDHCLITIVVDTVQGEQKTYRFECPKPRSPKT